MPDPLSKEIPMKATADLLPRTDGFAPVTYLVAGLGLAASAAVAWIELPLALLPLAVVLGWSHLSSV